MSTHTSNMKSACILVRNDYICGFCLSNCITVIMNMKLPSRVGVLNHELLHARLVHVLLCVPLIQQILTVKII